MHCWKSVKIKDIPVVVEKLQHSLALTNINYSSLGLYMETHLPLEPPELWLIH